MLSRLFRLTIQNNITRGIRCSGTIINGNITDKLQNVKQINLINHCNYERRFVSSTCSTTLPLHTPIFNSRTTLFSPSTIKSILNLQNLNIDVNIPRRSVVKFTRSRGKRQTVKTVLKRFYRLNWGIWIRTKAGRHNRLWKKRASRKRRLRRHVFCNATQSWLLDKMVSPYWRKPKYWVDDPYTPYHTREEFWITRKQPLD